MAAASPSLPPGHAWCGGIPYTYDAGESWMRRKHAGTSNHPAFVKKGKVRIGKCPKGFTQASAEAVLNAQDTLRLRKADSPPNEADWLFAIVDGALYRAVRTGSRGTAYHAFPECKTKFGQLPKWAQNEVLQWASRQQQSRNVRKWLDQTP